MVKVIRQRSTVVGVPPRAALALLARSGPRVDVYRPRVGSALGIRLLEFGDTGGRNASTREG